MDNQFSKPKDKKDNSQNTQHNFEPVFPLDLANIKDADEMLKAMSKTSFGGRQLGQAADVLYTMVSDPDCSVVMTLSGAMTVAKMGLVICEMIEKKMVQAVVSTGALITHGLVESVGMTHFKYDFKTPDFELKAKRLDRVYDTLELEDNLDDLEIIVDKIFGKFDDRHVVSSNVVTHAIGEYLSHSSKERGILKSAYENHVPVYIPAFTDSELGLDFALFNRKRVINQKKPLQFNPFDDLEHFTEFISKQKKTGIFTIGGGVPRNWAQQVAPYLDLIHKRIHTGKNKKNSDAPNDLSHTKRYTYAVRICPEPVNWGGLSGCTYSEGVSWGKFHDPEKEDGQFAEVLSDATLVWPLLMKGVLQRLEKNSVTIRKNF